MRVCLAAGLALLAGCGALAQSRSLSAEAALDGLHKQYRGKLPNCFEVSQARRAAEEDADWLAHRLARAGWEKVGPEYTASLNALLYTLREAADNRDVRAGCEAALAVMRDVRIKRADCREFGHSRTNIPVEIEVKQGRTQVSDWEVYTLWLPAGDRFTTEPKRLQGLSSPARGTVPVPGEYELAAKAPCCERTKPVRVSIGGAQLFKWSLQVPQAPSPKK
ncbi:MAG: hypothetical protein JO307_21470 [Bryobacterales bacterium]|nr:hypothetical protein [Bryobacterales bacterium]MBV9399779.1 hypothetical protein [Bryobacterales bacterium]